VGGETGESAPLAPPTLTLPLKGGGYVVAVLLPLLFAVPAHAQTVAVLQGLDKITARSSEFDAPVNETVHFGSLDITVRACVKRPPEETPETAAFLEINEVRTTGRSVETKQVFSGWMFASSPAVSAMENPIYDVNVLDCKTKTASAPASAPPGK
jgi:hypothetical protein